MEDLKNQSLKALNAEFQLFQFLRLQSRYRGLFKAKILKVCLKKSVQIS